MHHQLNERPLVQVSDVLICHYGVGRSRGVSFFILKCSRLISRSSGGRSGFMLILSLSVHFKLLALPTITFNPIDGRI